MKRKRRTHKPDFKAKVEVETASQKNTGRARINDYDPIDPALFLAPIFMNWEKS